MYEDFQCRFCVLGPSNTFASMVEQFRSETIDATLLLILLRLVFMTCGYIGREAERYHYYSST